jgi:tRNA pseudouridine38-40 synthase
MVHKVALLIAYNGSPYRGWNDVRDVAIRPTLSRILRHEVSLDAASRTDAGVHALGQVQRSAQRPSLAHR